jgi:RNA polymerase-binding protein DksA
MDAHEVRRKLEQRLQQLTDRLSKIEGHLRSPGPKDSQEWATEAENSEVLERLDEAERSEVEDIRAALARIDGGSYGRCGSCGSEIGAKRLAALPTTRTCIGCAS